VVLVRKVLKKVGQEVVVKLLPREVSKGEGSGALLSSVVVEVAAEGGRDVAVAMLPAVEEVSRRCKSCVST
jgi:hypothetical protein